MSLPPLIFISYKSARVLVFAATLVHILEGAVGIFLETVSLKSYLVDAPTSKMITSMFHCPNVVSVHIFRSFSLMSVNLLA